MMYELTECWLTDAKLTENTTAIFQKSCWYDYNIMGQVQKLFLLKLI